MKFNRFKLNYDNWMRYFMSVTIMVESDKRINFLDKLQCTIYLHQSFITFLCLSVKKDVIQN